MDNGANSQNNDRNGMTNPDNKKGKVYLVLMDICLVFLIIAGILFALIGGFEGEPLLNIAFMTGLFLEFVAVLYEAHYIRQKIDKNKKDHNDL